MPHKQGAGEKRFYLWHKLSHGLDARWITRTAPDGSPSGRWGVLIGPGRCLEISQAEADAVPNTGIWQVTAEPPPAPDPGPSLAELQAQQNARARMFPNRPFA